MFKISSSCHPLLRSPRLWISIGVIAGANEGICPMKLLFLTDDCYILISHSKSSKDENIGLRESEFRYQA